MPILLQTSGLSKRYGSQTIFDKLNFSVSAKQKIGIIGRNGAGKSTLLKIISGQESADEGEIVMPSDTRLGYLRQDEDFGQTETCLEYLLRISEKEVWTARKLAGRFQISERHLSQNAKELSGGWKMRLKLVAMLLSDPNLFLLDEPTNYLDLHTLILLENFLKSYKGSCLIVSHDREFLKQTCNQTLEIFQGGYYHYPGPLEEYLAFKEQKITTLIKQNEGLARQQEHMREFVDRFRASASKAKQAQALLRKIEKLEAKRITIEHRAGITRINIPPVAKRKSMALRVKKLAIGYDSPLVGNIDFEMAFGERLAVLGLNGQGKTTLLKTLAGVLLPLGGSFHWFSGGVISYHSQDAYEIMDMAETVGNHLRRLAAPDIQTEKILKMAGDFLFGDEDLKKQISVLSGGEKSRLSLATILLSKPDIMILDEPTSNLDFETVEALGQALQKFNGAIIFTSHDRTFTNLLATGLLQIDGEKARKRFQDYEDYIAELENSLQSVSETVQTPDPSSDKLSVYLEQKIRQKRLSSLEKELVKLNQRHAELMYYFSEHANDYSIDKVRELDTLNKEIRNKENQWLELSVKP